MVNLLEVKQHRSWSFKEPLPGVWEPVNDKQIFREIFLSFFYTTRCARVKKKEWTEWHTHKTMEIIRSTWPWWRHRCTGGPPTRTHSWSGLDAGHQSWCTWWRKMMNSRRQKAHGLVWVTLALSSSCLMHQWQPEKLFWYQLSFSLLINFASPEEAVSQAWHRSLQCSQCCCCKAKMKW